jgi:MFS family permease
MASARTPRIANYTWSRQWKAEVCTGIVAGATGLASFVAMRSLGAPSWTPQFMAVAGQAVWLVAPGLEAFTSHLDARRAFIWLGLLANIPLLLLALLPVTPTQDGHGAGLGPWGWFVAAIVVLTALDGLYLPLRAALIRANYAESVRGRFFGWLSAVSKSATVASSKFGGFLLDLDPRMLRVYFPLAGIAGIVEHFRIAGIRWHRTEALRPQNHDDTRGRFVQLLREGLGVLRTDRDFRTYEIAFMLYGMGFLMSNPLVAEFMNDTLRLSYGEATWALGFAEPVSYLAVALAVGPWFHRLGVVRVTCVSFAVLAIFFAALAFVATPFAFVALYFVFGAAMAGVNLGWNLGPMRFAPPGQARAYTAVHLLVVGVRIVIAPFVGYGLARLTGVPFVFCVASLLVAAGALTAARLARRVR